MWPYEMDFDKQSKKKQASGRKNSKCMPCKKLPLVKVELPLEAETLNPLGLNASQRFRTKYNYVTRTESDSKPQMTHLSQTYSSLRRSVSAKMNTSNQTPIRNYLRISMNRSRTMLTDTDQDKDEVDDEQDNDEDEREDEIELEVLRRNLEVNKEEQMRKMNILPGKTFRSQRTKSISIEHVPPSKIQLESQKSKITPTAYLQQGPPQTSRQVKQSKSAVSIDGLRRLAMQHQQEIYSLLTDKSRHNGHLINGQPIDVYLPSSKLKIIPISQSEIRSGKCLVNGVAFGENCESRPEGGLNSEQKTETVVYRRANKLIIKTRRPKTAKV